MRYIFGLFALAVIALGFFVWRTIARSPKLDNLFNFGRRDENAAEIQERRQQAERDLNTRGRTLGKKQTDLENELKRINKFKNQ